MAKITNKKVQDTVEQILEGKDLRDIKKELRNEGYSGTAVLTIIGEAKTYISEAANDLRDILPDLNLYRLNVLYTTSTTAPARDRSAIVKEMNNMLGLNRQEIDLNMNYVFEIGNDDDVKRIDIDGKTAENIVKVLGEEGEDGWKD